MDNYVEHEASYKCVTRICMGFTATLQRSQRFSLKHQCKHRESCVVCYNCLCKRDDINRNVQIGHEFFTTMRMCAIHGCGCSGRGQRQAVDNKNNIDKGCDMTPATKAMQGFFFAVLAHCFQKYMFERQNFLLYLLYSLHIS